MAKPKRNPDGTFPKGVSGNLGGRPREKSPSHRMPAENRRTAFEVAEMPVQMTINGKVETVSGYKGVLLSLFKRAMDGHAPSQREYLRHMRECAAVNGQQTEVVQFLVHELNKVEAELGKMRNLLPEAPSSGVYVEMPDGSKIPNSWYAKLQRLQDVDAREAKLREKERELEELQRRLGDGANDR